MRRHRWFQSLRQNCLFERLQAWVLQVSVWYLFCRCHEKSHRKKEKRREIVMAVSRESKAACAIETLGTQLRAAISSSSHANIRTHYRCSEGKDRGSAHRWRSPKRLYHMRRHRPLASDLCRRFARGSSRAANLRWLTRCSCCPSTCAQDDGERQRFHHVPSKLHDFEVTWHSFPKRLLHASIGANHLRAQPKSQILARAPLMSILRLPRSRWMTLCPCR